MDTVGGRYALDGRLGEGGMGQVYRAKHLQLGKAFALKIISPAFAGNDVARARFNQEAKLASEISHPNIVSVVDYGEDPQYGAYMVMELVEGEQLVTAGSVPMSAKRALDVLAQVADALEHIHKRGIIHGDVKADNIMLTSEGSGNSPETRRRKMVRLLDFGLARRPEPGDGEEGVSGTPQYLAPERVVGGSPSVASDIYALGILGYLLITGTLPFDGPVVEVLMAHVHNPIEPMSKRRGEEVDEALETLIGRALARDPSQRHGSAAAFRYELNTVMDMLDMGRRRSARGSGMLDSTTSRESTLQMAFDRSRIPQALVSIEGVMFTANKAFRRLVSKDDGVDGLQISELSIATHVPGLLKALRDVHTEGKPQERRASVYRGKEKASLELVLWLSPLPIPGQEIHLFVRVQEIRDADKDR